MASAAATPSIKVEESVDIKTESTDVSIKQEISVKQESIKPEDGFAAPSPMSEDDDQYEDAGDLDMNGVSNAAWLVKLPDFLIENWDKIDDDEEIHLANIRVYPGVNGPNSERVSI